MLLQICLILYCNSFTVPFWCPKFGGKDCVCAYFVFLFALFSCLEDRQFGHWQIICIYTTTVLQIAQRLVLNLRFVFEFGEIHNYETLLGFEFVGSLYRNCFTGPFWRPKFIGESWVFGNFMYFCLKGRQFWHWKLINLCLHKEVSTNRQLFMLKSSLRIWIL
jgi:hypothetical protein